MTTVNTTISTSGNSLKQCHCCGAITSILCVNGACVNCHSMGLCGHGGKTIE